ncbi:MAG: beta-ketoacyl-ACP synthase III [Myxococcota bacterium]|jgi:3-oxoacyl-[acyl-carrier-protein] synthase-3|nr:beta-ketoacyl-ACP synthase III [Myxococcota bacterium]
MPNAAFLGIGHYLPEKVVSNDDLAQLMDTSDEWIQQRTGIKTRHYVDFENNPMGASDLATLAAKNALDNAQITTDEIDLIIYATLSPDRFFPGDAVFVQSKLGIPAGVPALDIRNQCSGFIYGLNIANAFIQSGQYQKILLIGSEVHSTGLDFSNKGRDVAVIFGDGAAAAVLGPSDDPERGVVHVNMHADGRHADELHCPYPSSAEMPRATPQAIEEGRHFPLMNGKNVFKHAVSKMPESVKEALNATGLTSEDIKLLIPHQANLRIAEMVQRRLKLRDDQVFNNIQKYGNTTAASIPLALSEAVQEGRLEKGDLLCLTAFGAGFTWGAALIRW